MASLAQRHARDMRKKDALARQCENPPRCEPVGGRGFGRVSRLLPASAGIQKEAQSFPRGPGDAFLGGCFKMVEDVQKCKNTRERGDTTEAQRLSVKAMT